MVPETGSSEDLPLRMPSDQVRRSVAVVVPPKPQGQVYPQRAQPDVKPAEVLVTASNQPALPVVRPMVVSRETEDHEGAVTAKKVGRGNRMMKWLVGLLIGVPGFYVGLRSLGPMIDVNSSLRQMVSEGLAGPEGLLIPLGLVGAGTVLMVLGYKLSGEAMKKKDVS